MSTGLAFNVAGQTLTSWTRAEVVRDLTDISGSFVLDYLDEVREERTLAGIVTQVAAIGMDDPVSVTIDGVVVLKGWVDTVSLQIQGDSLSASITGRDVTGDLVDCSANPQGPGEYRNIGLLELVTKLVAPFGLTVTADTDLGDIFNVVAVDPAEPCMETIEKLARQRGVLITSDGIGGLVLTEAGTSRAGGSLSLPGNVRDLQARMNGQNLYSDVWVKGQFQPHTRPVKATLDSSVTPLTLTPPAAIAVQKNTQAEASAIVRYGHAINPDVRRYRPRVWLSATQSGGSAAAQAAPEAVEDTSGSSGVSSTAYHGHRKGKRRKPMKPRTDASPWTLQDQADWRMRSMRAQAVQRQYVVEGYDAADGTLWRPNSLVAVVDAYSGLDRDMLIGGIAYLDAEDGPRTRLRVVDPAAYDLTGDEDGSHNGRRRSSHTKASDAMARRFR